MSRPRLIALLLALVTLMVYLPVTHHNFLTYDDEEYVTKNWFVQQGLTWAGVRWAFTSFYAANWHPLTWLSHMTDCELFRLNPGAHHFVNALFHAANAALCFGLMWRLTQKTWPAGLVAALFAWHPLHVESVAWVAERKDVLSTFLALLALLSYTKFVKEKRRSCFFLAWFLFALGLMAKPMLVTLPFLMLLLDFWPLQRIPCLNFDVSTWRPLVAEKIPFFALSAASCVVTFFAQHSGGAVRSLQELPLDHRLENAILAVALYALKLLWPARLAVAYPFEKNPLIACVFAGAVLVFITVVAWSWRNRKPSWLMGWLWFLGALVPVIGLVQVGGTMMADRYTYMPSIGFFTAIAFGLPEKCWSWKSFQAGAVMVLILCVTLTEKQLGYWRDTETLFRHTLDITKNNLIGHINLGLAFENQGRYAEALEQFRLASKVDPAYAKIHFLTGNMLMKLGEPAAALAEYRKCLMEDPQVAALHNAAAGALVAQGNLTDALSEFAEASRLDPHYPQPHLDLAKIYFAHGEDGLARAELEAAVRAGPHDWRTLIVVARYLAANTNPVWRDGPSALAVAMKANEFSGERQPEVFDVLGMTMAANGDFTNAIICAQNALEFAPLAGVNDTSPFSRRLEMYQNRQPWLESFRGTNMPQNR